MLTIDGWAYCEKKTPACSRAHTFVLICWALPRKKPHTSQKEEGNKPSSQDRRENQVSRAIGTGDMMVWHSFLYLYVLLGITSVAGQYAELNTVKTTNSPFPVEQKHLMKCHNGLYYTMSSMSSSDTSIDGLYQMKEGGSQGDTLLVQISTAVRGLTCHESFLYYFRMGSDGKWGLYRYDLNGSIGSETFITDASDLSHEPLVAYNGNLYLGGEGPKLYKTSLSTSKPLVGLIWTGPGGNPNSAAPKSLVKHSVESTTSLFFVASNDQGDPCFWSFNEQADEVKMLKDLRLRTGDPDAGISFPISYKGPQDFQASLYMSAGGFASFDGHYRLSEWDGKALPMITLMKWYDPSHMVVFKEDLYMSARDPKDVSKYAVWKWNGRFAREVLTLPNEGRITSLVVWDDDFLVVAGDSGPLVVFDGELDEAVAVTRGLSDIQELVTHDGKLFLTAAGDPSQVGNGLWSLTKGVWKEPGDPGDSEKPTQNNPDTGNPGSDPGSSTNDVGPTWTQEITGSDSGNGWIKLLLILLVLSFMGALCYWAHKMRLRDDFGKSYLSDASEHELHLNDSVEKDNLRGGDRTTIAESEFI